MIVIVERVINKGSLAICMDSEGDVIEELLDLYNELLDELGVKYIGRAYRDNSNNRIPTAIGDVLCFVDLDTERAIDESANRDNLVLVGCFIYDKTEFLKNKKASDERSKLDYVEWPAYCRDIYFAELLTIASIKMHMANPDEVERIWIEIGKRYGLNARQSHALRIASYNPDCTMAVLWDDYMNEEGDYDSDVEEWIIDRCKIIDESNLWPFLEDLSEYSQHCFCKPDSCKIDASRIDRCRELHSRFDN